MKIRRSKLNAEVPVAGMSDIAFLLLIFFMVATTFIQESGIKLTPPKASQVESIESKSIIVAVDEEGKVYLNGSETTVISLKTGLAELLRGRDGDQRKVFFKCDKDIPRKIFEEALVSINEAQGKIVIIAKKSDLSKKQVKDAK